MLIDLTDWMNETAQTDCEWYVKRLSGNDTLANGTHQAGPYVPKDFLFRLFPSLNHPESENPDVWFDLTVDSDCDTRKVRAVWYNNKLRGGTRNETRITQLGGASSPLLDPESTGALTVFAFYLDKHREAKSCHVWVCRHETEEDLVEERVGPVEPGRWTVWKPGYPQQGFLTGSEDIRQHGSCWLVPDQIPASWLGTFPSGSAIIRKTLELRPALGMTPDRRLLQRRECEYEMFRSVEEAVELPNIMKGFDNIDDFIARAQTILQRRKARAGRSLELHAREIFMEEGLKEDENFSHGAESDPGKRPDFIFPSAAAYRNPTYPEGNLRMLAVKTTCKDRWRQILNEADRISIKHLFTLQEGVSVNQFHEMVQSNVRLVVPEPLVAKYPKIVQPALQTLESFIGDIRLLVA
jgi:EcoRII C terminal/Restriction endonuclease EcoRII, N-terminal